MQKVWAATGGDVVCAVTGVYGIVHAGLQFGIVGHDDRKIGVINSIFGDGKPSKEVDQEKLKAGRVAAGKLVTLFDGQKSDGHLDSKKFETWLNIHFDEKGKAFPGNTESATATENAKKVIEALELIATTDHNHTKNTDSDRESTDRKRIEWVRACYIYWIWAKKPGVGLNNGVKGTGNFFDTVPEIAQFLAIPEFVESSEGITLAIAVATDAIGHVVEGGTYLARTANHALY